MIWIRVWLKDDFRRGFGRDKPKRQLITDPAGKIRIFPNRRTARQYVRNHKDDRWQRIEFVEVGR